MGKGICVSCEQHKTIIARGCCYSCYNLHYPKALRKKYMPRGTNKAAKATRTTSVDVTGFPRKQMIPIWTTSDGREWGTEIEAVRHELSIEQEKTSKLRRIAARHSETE